MAFYKITGVIEYLLQNSLRYPGPHNVKQIRNSPEMNELEPLPQLMMIWNVMCKQIEKELLHSRSVVIQNFGSFTFESLISPGSTSTTSLSYHPSYKNNKYNFEKISNQKNNKNNSKFCFLSDNKKKNYILIPRFVLSDSLRKCINKLHEKEVLENEFKIRSMYDRVQRANFLNIITISAKCYLDRKVVESGIQAIFKCIQDIIERQYNLELNFNFCDVFLSKGNVKAQFKQYLQRNAEHIFKNIPNNITPVSNRWTLANFAFPPNEYISTVLKNKKKNEQKALEEKNLVQKLGLMSIDFASIKPNSSKIDEDVLKSTNFSNA